jgi:hypothetical protein
MNFILVSDRSEHAQLLSAIEGSALLREILARWNEVQLPDCWLVAGAVAQAIWNRAHGFADGHGVKDVDLVYFDPAHLDAGREHDEELRVRALFADLNVSFDVKNEARVHLWYAAKFGYPIKPYIASEDAIATFPTTATAIGIRPVDGGIACCAPFGLSDLLNLIVRPNKVQISEAVYDKKRTRWSALWPKLTVVEWD